MRELDWMVKGRLAVAWDLQSWLLAMTANVHRDTKKHPKPFPPRDFNPTLPPKRMESFSEMEADLVRMGFKKPKKKE